jgi:hypothetical protein
MFSLRAVDPRALTGEAMTDAHPLATDHLPIFMTAPGQTDVLMTVMWIVFIGAVMAAGVFFFWLHSLPERMVHSKIQFDIVAVLALLSLFTHQHAFWVAALLIALISFPDLHFPDFSGLLGRIARSLESIAATAETGVKASPLSQDKPADAVPNELKPSNVQTVVVVERVTAHTNTVPKREREKAEG